MGGPHKRDTRVRWDIEPSLSTSLLNTINNNPSYRETLFGTTGERWAAERDVALKVLQDEPWMIGQEKAGLVKRNGDGWEATSAWTSGMTHPVRNRLNVLAKRMESEYYADRFSIEPQWTSEDDIPEELKRDFYRYIPYYFVLRALTVSGSRARRPRTSCSGSTPTAGKAPAEYTPSAPSKSTPKCRGKGKQVAGKMEGGNEEEEEGDLDLAEGAVGRMPSDNDSNVLYPEPLTSNLYASHAGPSSLAHLSQPVKEGEDELDLSQPVVVQKKRGRPTGSTNKKKAEKNEVKRPRGRPRKNPLPAGETAPKPAKPKKVVIKTGGASVGGAMEEEADEPDDDGTMGTASTPATGAAGAPSVIPRKRGRPVGSRTKRPEPGQMPPSVPTLKRKLGRPLGSKDKQPRRNVAHGVKG